MKKILIMSDSHGSDTNMKNVIEKEKPFDVLIHLGDLEGSEEYLPDLLDPGTQIYMLKGNNDFYSPDLPNDLIIDLGGHHIFLTHGHYYRVNMGVDQLLDKAREFNCDIAMFGHTHRPYFDTIYGVTILNPGSISYPRQKNRKPSYMVMTVDDNGKCRYHEYYI